MDVGLIVGDCGLEDYCVAESDSHEIRATIWNGREVSLCSFPSLEKKIEGALFNGHIFIDSEKKAKIHGAPDEIGYQIIGSDLSIALHAVEPPKPISATDFLKLYPTYKFIPQAGLPDIKNIPTAFIGPKPLTYNPLPPIPEITLFHNFDGCTSEREAALKRAEQLAKEIRYPYLVHSQDEINLAKSKYEAAFNDFMTKLPSQIGLIDVAAVALAIKAVADACKKPGFFSVVGALGSVLGTIGLNEKLAEIAAPAVEAKQNLSKLELENAHSSVIKCDYEKYCPLLIFVPESDTKKFILVDKNNPNDHQINIEVE